MSDEGALGAVSVSIAPTQRCSVGLRSRLYEGQLSSFTPTCCLHRACLVHTGIIIGLLFIVSRLGIFTIYYIRLIIDLLDLNI